MKWAAGSVRPFLIVIGIYCGLLSLLINSKYGPAEIHKRRSLFEYIESWFPYCLVIFWAGYNYHFMFNNAEHIDVYRNDCSQTALGSFNFYCTAIIIALTGSIAGIPVIICR